MKIGDRVSVKNVYDDRSDGTIIKILKHRNYQSQFLVEHDIADENLHDGNGDGENFRCWYYFTGDLTLLSPLQKDTFWEEE